MSYDINNLNFRPLHADEIEIRVGNVGQRGAFLLLYQNSRCAMDILDEAVGASNWQRDHKEVKNNMYCGIGIWDSDKGAWTWKWDCGVESNTEKEKGEASDSFKRASVNWGIARELYSSPRIHVKCPTQPKQKGSGYELTDRYMFSDAEVSHIKLDGNRKISELIIKNGDETIFEYPKNVKPKPRTHESQPSKPADYTPYDMMPAEDADFMKRKLADLNYDTATFLAYVGKKMKRSIMSVDEMTKDEYVCGMQVIEAMEKKGKNQ